MESKKKCSGLLLFSYGRLKNKTAMLYKIKYSQENIENFKSLVFDEKLFKKITGVVSNNKWIYFEPEPFDKISEKKIKTMINVKVRRVVRKQRDNFRLFCYI